MIIGIITAMPGETGAIVRTLGHAKKMRANGMTMYRALSGGHVILVAEAGMGAINASGTSRQLMGGSRPDLLISAGFCGGITAGLQVGDAVLAAELATVSENGLSEVTVTIPDLCGEFVSRLSAEGQRVFSGLFVSTTAIMEKSRLAALLPAGALCPVVEMESAAIAGIAAENGIPFIGLRTVSDPYDEELGFSLDEFCDGQMRIRIPRVLITILRKPRIIPQLIRLARNSGVAADALSRTVGRLLAVM